MFLNVKSMAVVVNASHCTAWWLKFFSPAKYNECWLQFLSRGGGCERVAWCVSNSACFCRVVFRRRLLLLHAVVVWLCAVVLQMVGIREYCM